MYLKKVLYCGLYNPQCKRCRKYNYRLYNLQCKRCRKYNCRLYNPQCVYFLIVLRFMQPSKWKKKN